MTYTRYLFYSFVMLLLLAGCKTKRLNQFVSLWRGDKIPYGSYYAYENLAALFPLAQVAIADRSPDIFRKNTEKGSLSVNNFTPSNGGAYIIINKNTHPDEAEVKALMNYMAMGNAVFISSFTISQILLDSLDIHISQDAFHYMDDSLIVSVQHPENRVPVSFAYPGKRMNRSFASYDSARTTVLGQNADGTPNFIRISMQGGGAAFIHLAPLAFSNFFLLHRNNSRYYDYALSHIPGTVSDVLWDDYFRYNKEETREKNTFSKLGAFINDPILRWPFWLVICLFLLLFLVETKRRQRAIPVIHPPGNSSLDMVRTIGALYFQRRDNRNLAEKMTLHFMDFVRQRYGISAQEPDEKFIRTLAVKSGYELHKLEELAYLNRYLQDQQWPEDDRLLEYQQQLNSFYKYSA